MAKRGFALLDPERLRQVASKGGVNAHLKGTAFEWDSESARKAGRKGGQNSRGGRRVALEPKGEK